MVVFGWSSSSPRIASPLRLSASVKRHRCSRSLCTESESNILQTRDRFIPGADGTITVEFEKNPFRPYKCEPPPPTTTTTKSELIHFFREMSRIRRVEITCNQLYTQKQIRGFLHLYNGQEAIVAGYESVITKDDHVITAYRDHGHFMGRGGTPFEVFAELMGKVDGCAAGKGGSMHMYKKEANFHGGNGIVGAQIPVGTGIAFAMKYLGTDRVCLCFYGDGAANQGQAFEAYNMAALWKLPVLYVCENNKYGMGTSAERAAANTDYYTRGDVIPGLKIDAMNVLAVKSAVQFSVDYLRKGNGPMILEMETYRYMGHSMSDPGLSYRTKAEVKAIQAERDPIERVRAWLLNNNLATTEELEAIEKEVKAEVDEALQKAKAAPFPPEKNLYEDVYTTKPYYVRAVELPNSQIVRD